MMLNVVRNREWSLGAVDFGLEATSDLHVIIRSLPAGKLSWDADGTGPGTPVPVTVGQSLTRADLDTGKLSYLAAAGDPGTDALLFDLADAHGNVVKTVQSLPITVVNQGALVTKAASLSGTTQLHVNAGSSVSVASGDTAVKWNGASTAVQIDNNGIIESTYTGGRAINASGAAGERTLTFINHAGAVLQAENDAFRINVDVVTGHVVIQNSGLILSSAGGQAIDFDAVSSTQAGQIEISNLATGVIRANAADAVRPGQGATVTNAGLIYADGDTDAKNDGIDFQTRSGTVYNLTGGVISGKHQGINADHDVTVYNDAGGLIIGRNGAGVGTDGTGKVVNYGTIVGGWEGTGSGDGDGVDFDDRGEVDNYGTIRADSAGGHDSTGEPNSAEGVVIGGGYIYNHVGGTIYSAFFGVAAGHDTQITNEGTIFGQAYGVLIAGNAQLHNALGGVIKGPGFGLNVVDGSATIRNDGLIETTYGLWFYNEAGASTLTNNGTISAASGAAILFGAYDDTLTIEAGSVIQGSVDGGAGVDTLILQKGAVFATAANFEILKAAGDATLTGNLAVQQAQIMAGATLTIGDGGATGLLNGDVLIDGVLAIDRAGTLDLAGVLSGSGGLNLIGTGLTALNMATSYTGVTRILAGTLALGANADIAASSGIVVDGVLDLTARDATTAITNLGGSGTVMLGGGTLVLGSANGTFAGTIVGAGAMALVGTSSLTLSGEAAWTGGGAIGKDAALVLAGTAAALAGSFELNGTLDLLTQGLLNISLSGQGDLVKQGTGTVTLLGTGDFAGTVTLAGGALELANDRALGGAAIDFGAGDATLRLANGTGFTNSLRRFFVGDHVDLLGLSAAGATATMTAGGIQITSGNEVAALALQPDPKLRLVLGDDGTGHVLLGESATANTAPTAADGRVILDENGSVVLTAATFGYADADGDAIGAIIIASLPAAGHLLLGGTPVAAGQVIAAADLAAGQLVFKPDADAFGAEYATISFQVRDNGGTAGDGIDTDAVVHTLAIDVTAVDRPALAVDDVFAVAEAGTAGGNLLANDSDPDGPALTVAQVDGAAANVGRQITLASGALLTVAADGSFVYDPNHRFDALATPASGAANTSATDGFSYTLAGGGTATVLLTITGVAGAGDILKGSVGNDALLGTAGADLFDISQGGSDQITAGAGDDVIRAGPALDGLDRIDGGDGSDTVFIDGDYSAAHRLVIGRGNLTSVESLAAVAGHSYAIVLSDGALDTNPSLMIDGSALASNDALMVDGSALRVGALQVDGGFGDDFLIGGAGDDSFYFGPGAWGGGDHILGGEGADRLVLGGDYTLTLDGRADVETLVLARGDAHDPYHYVLTLGDGFVPAGGTRTIDATAVTTPLTIDTSAQHDGRLVLHAGSGDDLIVGGGGNDLIDGGGGLDTVIFAGTLAQATITRRSVTILAVTIGGRTDTLTGVETLRFDDGTVTVRNVNRYVDNLFYSQTYTDVFHARINPAADYYASGAAKGRDPNAFFSTTGYLVANPDVAKAGMNPLDHYIQYGAAEGRDPSAVFDTTLYLLHNPDVAHAGVNPLQHYLNYGRFEGRAAYAAIGNTVMQNGFDPEYYLLANPDVAATGMDPWQHYLQYGAAEGRNPNAWFDNKGYLAANPDVAASGMNPLVHYDIYGWKEGRDPSATFDTKAYLAANPDVAFWHMDPLYHYLEYGAYEMRAPLGDGVMAHG